MPSESIPRDVRQAALIIELFKQFRQAVKLSKRVWELVVICEQKSLYPVEQMQEAIDSGDFALFARVDPPDIIRRLEEILARAGEIAGAKRQAITQRFQRVMRHKMPAAEHLKGLTELPMSAEQENELRHLVQTIRVQNRLFQREVKELKKLEGRLDEIARQLEERDI